MQGVTLGRAVVSWVVLIHQRFYTNLVSEELVEEMTEAVVGSNEDPAEETEDPEPLEPDDDGGKKVGPTPAFLSRPVLAIDSLRACPSLGLGFSACTRTGRPRPIVARAWLPRRRRREGLGAGALPATATSAPPLHHLVSGTFQQVTNLLNIMDSGSAKTDAAGGTGPDMRKMLVSVIITEKATTEPSAVINALIRCLQVPEVGPAGPRPRLGARPPVGQHTLLTIAGTGLGAGAQTRARP